MAVTSSGIATEVTECTEKNIPLLSVTSESSVAISFVRY